MGVPLLKIVVFWGLYHFRGPCNKDYSILGSILGSPHFGKLPFKASGDAKLQLWVQGLGLRV